MTDHIKYHMPRQQFIHRHSKFPPTAQNIFLLGLLAGVAIVAIVAALISAINSHLSTINF